MPLIPTNQPSKSDLYGSRDEVSSVGPCCDADQRKTRGTQKI